MSNNTFAPQPWDPSWHPSLQALKDYQASNYVGIAAITLLLYDTNDTILTAPDAVKYIYSRKFTVISWLYILAQYGAICQLVFNWAVFTNTLTGWVANTCNALNLTYYLTFIASAVGIQGLLFSRAYAVAPRNRIVTGILGTLYLVNIGIAFSLLRWWKCDTPQGDDFTTISAIGQISLVLFDIGVLSTILYHTLSLIRQQRNQEGHSSSLSALFIRQGVFRFVIISAWSLGDALAYKLARPSASGSDTTLEIALSPILLGRFLFQLRQAAETTDNLTETEGTAESHQLTSFRAASNNVDSTLLSGRSQTVNDVRTTISCNTQPFIASSPTVSTEAYKKK